MKFLWSIYFVYFYGPFYIASFFMKHMVTTNMSICFFYGLFIQGLVNVPMFHITQLFGRSSPTDIWFGDVKPIPKKGTSIPTPVTSCSVISRAPQGLTMVDRPKSGPAAEETRASLGVPHARWAPSCWLGESSCMGCFFIIHLVNKRIRRYIWINTHIHICIYIYMYIYIYIL